jgi:hypothetical protein
VVKHAEAFFSTTATATLTEGVDDDENNREAVPGSYRATRPVLALLRFTAVGLGVIFLGQITADLLDGHITHGLRYRRGIHTTGDNEDDT